MGRLILINFRKMHQKLKIWQKKQYIIKYYNKKLKIMEIKIWQKRLKIMQVKL